MYFIHCFWEDIVQKGRTFYCVDDNNCYLLLLHQEVFSTLDRMVADGVAAETVSKYTSLSAEEIAAL